MKNTGWDDICNRCGMCCYSSIKTDDGGYAVDLSAPCKYLDEETMLCSVYENRFIVYPGCGKMTFLTALTHPTLPPNCAYVRKFRPWRNLLS